MFRYLFTHSIAISGAMIFLLLNMPLPWLFGPLTACLIAALLGANLRASKLIGNSMRTILGIAAGASVTPAFFHTLPSMVPTLCIIPLMTIIIGVLGVYYFKWIASYDFQTAYYSSMPGGLQDMIVFGEEAGANVRALSLVHATRILVIVVTLPIVLNHVWDVSLSSPPGSPISSVHPIQVSILLTCAIVGWSVAKWLGMFGAAILGPLILAAVLTLSGFLTVRPPAEAIWAAQYFIALGIGVKYVGISMSEVKRDIFSGLGFCFMLGCLTAIVVLVALYFEVAPAIDAILALTPGGQAELLVLAIIVGADISFVVAHHLLRLFSVILGAPIVAALISPRLRD